MKKMLAITLAAMLVGCGGGGGESAPVAAVTPNPTPIPMGDPVLSAPIYEAQTPVLSPVVNPSILVFGDSTMAEGGYPEHPAPYYLQQLTSVPVENKAVSGTVLIEMLNGNNNSYKKPMRDVLAQSSANIVIENYGINDTLDWKGENFQQYVTGLNTFIDQVRAAGKIPVLEEPNPTCGTSGMTAALDVRVDALNKVAEQRGVLVIHQYLSIQKIENYCAMYEPTGVHPLTALTQIKAQNEYNAIKGLLQ